MNRILALFAFVFLASCGDTITFVECPPGTEPVGSQCVTPGPLPGDSDVLTSSTPFPGRIVDVSVTPDLGPPSVPDEGPGDLGSITDATPPDAGLGAPIGASCRKGDDCADGTCLGWPDGYCTRLDCLEDDCPDGALCMPLPGGNTGCLVACDPDQGCAGSAQGACKRLSDISGQAYQWVCHGAGEQGAAALCQAHEDCAGAAACLSNIAGGYCAVTDCSDSDACPSGTACVSLDGTPSCLLRCVADEDCPGASTSERACSALMTVDLGKLDLCITAAGSAQVGEVCSGSVECSTNECEILGQGRCSQSGGPCDDEGDCDGAEFCSVTPDSRVGYCTQDCGLNALCPGVSYCAGGGIAGTGSCRAACSGPDDGTCTLVDGLSCAYGYPVGGTTGQGRYLCAPFQAAGPGTACSQHSDCASGNCRQETPDGAGLCVLSCGLDQHCPFPTTCVTGNGGPALCERTCLSPLDCPTGTQCVTPSGSARKVCR